MQKYVKFALALAGVLVVSKPASADENLFGFVRGAEPLPKGAWELYGRYNTRSDKGTGHYEANDIETELEYGLTDRVAVSAAINFLAIDTSGVVIDGYLPGDNEYGPRFAGGEAAVRYNFLSPARAPLGVAGRFAISYGTRDPHSGQDKDILSVEEQLLLQKYFLDGQLIWAGNITLEQTRAKREPIDDLPPDFDWPTTAEMELGLDVSMGLTYRFAPNWFLGAELLYASEHETEVDLERWSLQGGPTLHYGGARWWATFTWLTQLEGGGEVYPGQPDTDLHLIEKTRDEWRLKVGYNF